MCVFVARRWLEDMMSHVPSNSAHANRGTAFKLDVNPVLP